MIARKVEGNTIPRLLHEFMIDNCMLLVFDPSQRNHLDTEYGGICRAVLLLVQVLNVTCSAIGPRLM